MALSFPVQLRRAQTLTACAARWTAAACGATLSCSPPGRPAAPPFREKTPSESCFLGRAMAEAFKVRVTKDHLVFCSGHFISYEGDKCERLHGHNYRATVEIEGDLDANAYVFDFIALKRHTKAVTDELDHRMLL